MMKTLLLTRHAKTVQGNGQMRDFDRFLAPRGPKDVLLVANEMKTSGQIPDLIISSPAKRARQTAELFAQHFNHPTGDIQYLDFLYGYYATDQVIHELNRLGAKASRIMLIAHNPSIADLGDYFTGGFHQHLPTSGILAIDFEVKRWKYISRNSGSLTQFVYPKALRE
ncbi:MAG: hypothetical protein HN352_16935 [Bacteroidetes bacterium]|nr:hypothetical protein [Bacteroidota bacterium]MBT7941506.1 hypothetical protein [Candidatus Neomarinimicrobiota bacterium]MBT3749468.1 hypothetical protein [Bacteroidota bacterium]MBT4400564.1 hypothetical protein [Bacteroidota bacterium]MBT4411587.1 hypothetical protein [Bacteroidota bacterium]